MKKIGQIMNYRLLKSRALKRSVLRTQKQLKNIKHEVHVAAQRPIEFVSFNTLIELYSNPFDIECVFGTEPL